MRWLNRAEQLWKAMSESSNVDQAGVELAWQSLRHFVEAKDLRTINRYEMRRLKAGREHRLGVKKFKQATDIWRAHLGMEPMNWKL